MFPRQVAREVTLKVSRRSTRRRFAGTLHSGTRRSQSEAPPFLRGRAPGKVRWAWHD